MDSLQEQLRAVLAQRTAERQELLAIARNYVEGLQSRLPIVAAAVVGSVARGDFNVWSDLDILLVAESLPHRLLDRLQELMVEAPPRVEAIGFTPHEFRSEMRKGNPLVLEALGRGVPLKGKEFFDLLSTELAEVGLP